MASILDYIRSLESYALRSGVRLVRSPLPEAVHGRVSRDLIVLRTDLDPEQELLTLVHELAHWLAHRGVPSHEPSTVFEYEAEAVEALVMARLGLPRPSDRGDSPTDDLLSASVSRVISASSRICDALGVGTGQRLEP
ncbi:MAG: ImmA/IrrE family metallo-endopeptidase [Steroidobacteraceae bacterium]